MSDGIVTLPTSDYYVSRRGLGYLGSFRGVRFSLTHVHESRGTVNGQLTINIADRDWYRGAFNVSSVQARKSMSSYVSRAGVEGFDRMLEKFCWHVLELHQEPPPSVWLEPGSQPAARRSRLLDPLMPSGVTTILFGPGGSFKSTIAAGIALSVQTGIRVIDGWTPQQGNVLILDWEGEPDDWNDRLERIAAGANVPRPPMLYRQAFRPLVDLVEDVAALIADHKISLLVVDSVGLAQGSAGEGPAEQPTLRMFQALREIGTTTLLIDHVRGDDVNAERASGKPYGSTYKMNLARSVFELRAEGSPLFAEAREVALVHRKMNDAALLPAQGLRVVHGDSAIMFERCEITAPDLEQHAVSHADRIAKFLRDGKRAATEIAEALSISPRMVSAICGRSSRFVRLERGVWALASA